MKYRWILFDADGTLFDYDSAEFFAFKTTLEKYGYSATPDSLKMYRRINSRLFRELEIGQIKAKELRTKRFKLLFSQLNFKIDVNEFSRQYLGNLSKASQLLPEALKTVKALSSKYKLLIITNGVGEVQRSRLNASELKPYFEDIVTSDEVGAAKPSKAIFDIAFEKMNMPAKKETLIVGDSLTSDMCGGVNFGIDTCWYNPFGMQNDQNFEVTYEIQNLEQIINFVR